MNIYAMCTSVKTCPRDCAVTCISKSLSAVISLFTVLSFIFHNFEKYSKILWLSCWTYFELAEMHNANHNVTMHSAQCTVHIAPLQPFSYNFAILTQQYQFPAPDESVTNAKEISIKSHCNRPYWYIHIRRKITLYVIDLTSHAMPWPSFAYLATIAQGSCNG